ncbi:MAG TPA: hypothetical protein VK484_14945, partial [Ferruginibacter sp.]|nr:hypothetical protein [Ferruginibacter sp.]
MIKFAKFLIALLSVSLSSFAQNDEVPKGWHLMDKETDGFYGVSAAKAYDFIKSKNLKSKTVLVAVIDSGIDTLQEDLKPILWNNPKEIPGNGIDDDKNGYIDDVHGWNFLGGKDGRNVKEDSYEGARVYYALKSKWDNKEVVESSLSKENAYEYAMFKKARAQITGNDKEDAQTADVDLPSLKQLYTGLLKSDSILKIGVGKEIYTGKELEDYTTKSPEEKRAKVTLLGLMKANNMAEQSNKEFVGGLNEYIEFMAGEQRKADAKKNAPPNYRKDIVGDDENNFADRNYGNSDIMASTPMHGT